MADNLLYGIHQAVALDGNFKNTPFLQDLNMKYVGYIIPTIYIDPSTGASTSGWEVSYWSEKEIRYQSIIFKVSDFATVDDLIDAINTAAGFEYLHKYTNWIKRNLFHSVTSASIGLNNYHIKLREYVASKNETNIHINLGNTLDHDIFTCSGNLSKAATEYYA